MEFLMNQTLAGGKAEVEQSLELIKAELTRRHQGHPRFAKQHLRSVTRPGGGGRTL